MEYLAVLTIVRKVSQRALGFHKTSCARSDEDSEPTFSPTPYLRTVTE